MKGQKEDVERIGRKSPFNTAERMFNSVEHTFNDVERTFNVAERRIPLGVGTSTPRGIYIYH